MKSGALWGTLILVAALSFGASGCGKSSFEQGMELYEKGVYEQALPHLEKAKKEGDHYIKAEELIRKAKAKIEEEADQDCLRRAGNYVDVLSQAKTVESWDKVIQELKSFRCRKLNTKSYVDRAYYQFIAYLSEWDAYPQAVEKFCEHTGCEAKAPHILIREEEVTIIDDDGKEKEETIQREIPIAQHGIALEMFYWLARKDMKNARWFDRYAKFLYDNERFAEAKEAYESIVKLEGVGYEFKSRAELTVEHLKIGRHLMRESPDKPRFFWIEEVGRKSRLKALRRDLEKAKNEREEAERKRKAVEGAEK